MRPILLLVLVIPGLIPGLPPGVSASRLAAQAVPRSDTPRAGTLRVTFDAVVSAWDHEFTPAGRRPIGAGLPATVFVHAERRVTPLTLEFGLTDRIALAARLPLVRVMNRVGYSPDTTADSVNAALDSLLADTTYAYTPITSTRHALRYFPGEAELQAKVRLGPREGRYAAAAQLVVRLPTGHLDSPHDLFDLATGDHQTDIEVGVIQELTVARRLWLNLSVRGTQQRRGTRERRVAPEDSLLVPRAAWASLAWDPGDALALDVAPMYRFNRYFAAGVTAGYFTKGRDHYTFAGAADSVALATRLGSPRSASVLDAGTSERRLRIGAAVTYVGPGIEGGLSFEQTVSGVGGRIPVASVFRIVLRTSRWPF